MAKDPDLHHDIAVDAPHPEFIRGTAMVLAQACRGGHLDIARSVSVALNLTYGAFTRAGVDEADLEELRDLFGPFPPGDVVPFKSPR